MRKRNQIILTVVVVVILGDVGLGFYWNVEPAPLPAPQTKQKVGVASTTELIDSIETLLNKPGGFLSNDVMPPGVLMDNIPSWEYGALIQLRDFAYLMRNQFSRPQAQSVRDDDLALAVPKLNISRKSWLFPRAETSYSEAADYLKRYRARLEGKEGPEAYFLNRPNNLDLWLQVVSRRLGGLTQELAQVGGVSSSLELFRGPNPIQPQRQLPPGGDPPVSSTEGLENLFPVASLPNQDPAQPAEPPPSASHDAEAEARQRLNHPYLLADNYFYRARGAAWALLNLCRGIEIDFHDQLAQKEALDSFRFLEQTLEASQKTLTTPIIMSGDYFSLLPNHPLTLAAFLASANATVINIRRMLIAD